MSNVFIGGIGAAPKKKRSRVIKYQGYKIVREGGEYTGYHPAFDMVSDSSLARLKKRIDRHIETRKMRNQEWADLGYPDNYPVL